MRSLLVLLVALATVQAIFRPDNYGGGQGHHHDDDCSHEKHHTKKIKTTTTVPTTTTAPTTTTTTAKPVPKCPSGYDIFHRTPSPYNNNTGVWCMRVIPSEVPISVNQASALCKANGGELTNYESGFEQFWITSEGVTILNNLKLREGSIAIAGNRVPECVSLNKTYLEYPPCNDKTTLYKLPESSHTDPAFTWASWSANEPSSNMWTYDVEECMQLYIRPGNVVFNGLINDIYCSHAIPPNAPEEIIYRNYGALCGVAPDFV